MEYFLIPLFKILRFIKKNFLIHDTVTMTILISFKVPNLQLLCDQFLMFLININISDRYRLLLAIKYRVNQKIGQFRYWCITRQFRLLITRVIGGEI